MEQPERDGHNNKRVRKAVKRDNPPAVDTAPSKSKGIVCLVDYSEHLPFYMCEIVKFREVIAFQIIPVMFKHTRT